MIKGELFENIYSWDYTGFPRAQSSDVYIYIYVMCVYMWYYMRSITYRTLAKLSNHNVMKLLLQNRITITDIQTTIEQQ